MLVTRTLILQGYRRFARLLVVVLVLTHVFPGARLLGAPAALAAPAADEQPPQPLTVAPVTEPHLPSLTLQSTVTPDPVAVGDTATLPVTVANGAPDPAENPLLPIPT